MSALDLLSRKVEAALPVADQTREKLSKEGSVKRWVSKGLVCLVVVWTVVVVLLGFRFLSHTTNEAFQQDLRAQALGGGGGGDINGDNLPFKRQIPQLRRAEAQGWKPNHPSPKHLHGEALGQLPNGQPHPWESDLKLPLDRDAKDNRPGECRSKSYDERYIPSTSVIIIFCNEPFETLMRTVHSILNTASPKYLQEIVLIDDGSDATHIVSRESGGSGQLEDYISLLPPKIKLIRTGYRSGIVGARLRGIREASGEAFVILDSHVEAQPGWLEALVYPIGQDPTNVVMPHIDGLEIGTFAYKHGGVGCTLGIIWKVMEHAFDPNDKSPPARRNASPSEYVTSPTMAGGLFAANKEFFLSIGGYDEQMTGWGAENVEFSFRLWQCGGKLLCSDCSRLYHLFGGGKHYQTKGGSYTVNRMRTMAAWMDEYADLSWHVLGRPSLTEVGNITDMLTFRKNKKCKSFQWFLDEVWPESEVRKYPDDVPFTGPIKSTIDNLCMPSTARGSAHATLVPCTRRVGSYTFWRSEGRITVETNDETCWHESNKFDWCHYHGTTGWEVHVIATEGEAYFEKVVGDDLTVLGIDRDIEKYDQAFQGRGRRILAQIISPKGECLTTIETKPDIYQATFTPCDKDLPQNQLWTWFERRQHPFWRQIHQ